MNRDLPQGSSTDCHLLRPECQERIENGTRIPYLPLLPPLLHTHSAQEDPRRPHFGSRCSPAGIPSFPVWPILCKVCGNGKNMTRETRQAHQTPSRAEPAVAAATPQRPFLPTVPSSGPSLSPDRPFLPTVPSFTPSSPPARSPLRTVSSSAPSLPFVWFACFAGSPLPLSSAPLSALRGFPPPCLLLRNARHLPPQLASQQTRLPT